MYEQMRESRLEVADSQRLDLKSREVIDLYPRPRGSMEGIDDVLMVVLYHRQKSVGIPEEIYNLL